MARSGDATRSSESVAVLLHARPRRSIGRISNNNPPAVLSILLIARSTGDSGADDGCGNCASPAVLSAVLKVPRGECTVSDDHGRS
jgi:hypothetical protein